MELENFKKKLVAKYFIELKYVIEFSFSLYRPFFPPLSVLKGGKATAQKKPIFIDLCSEQNVKVTEIFST